MIKPQNLMYNARYEHQEKSLNKKVGMFLFIGRKYSWEFEKRPILF